MNKYFIVLVGLVLIFSHELKASNFGVGFGGANVPHYLGSQEYYEIAIPFPVYLSDNNVFYEESSVLFEFDSNLTLPISAADSDATKPEKYDDNSKYITGNKNYARRGMGYTPPGFYFGLKTGFRIGNFSLEVSSTPGVQLGNDWGSAGLLSEVTLNWYAIVNNSGKSAHCLCFSVSSFYSNETYNQLFYGVKSNQVLSDREEYNADKSGFLGRVASVYYMQRINSIMLMGFVAHQTMHGSVVEKSPLVRRKDGGSAGAGIAYMF